MHSPIDRVAESTITITASTSIVGSGMRWPTRRRVRRSCMSQTIAVAQRVGHIRTM